VKEKNEKQLTRAREEYAAYAHRKADERGAKFGDSGAARCHAVPVKKKWKGRSESGEMILHELRVSPKSTNEHRIILTPCDPKATRSLHSFPFFSLRPAWARRAGE
jgi:hypothetical protein